MNSVFVFNLTFQFLWLQSVFDSFSSNQRFKSFIELFIKLQTFAGICFRYLPNSPFKNKTFLTYSDS